VQRKFDIPKDGFLSKLKGPETRTTLPLQRRRMRVLPTPIRLPVVVILGTEASQCELGVHSSQLRILVASNFYVVAMRDPVARSITIFQSEIACQSINRLKRVNADWQSGAQCSARKCRRLSQSTSTNYACFSEEDAKFLAEWEAALVIIAFAATEV
jgi:hypothetical protein